MSFQRKTGNIICVQRPWVHGESLGRLEWPRMGGWEKTAGQSSRGKLSSRLSSMAQETLFSLLITFALLMSLFCGVVGTRSIHQRLWGFPMVWMSRLIHRAISMCLSSAPVALGQCLSLRRGIRPMTLMSWLTDLELVAQAKMIRMEIFTSGDLTRFWILELKWYKIGHLISVSISRQ